MAPNVFERLVPGVAELRARERFNRSFAFARLTRRVCGVELRALTPELRLELQLVENAFVCGVVPLAGDVFAVLWILNAARNRQSGLFVKLANSVRQFFLRRHVRRMDLATAVREIRIFFVEQLQDMAETSGDGIDQSPWVHWIAGDASWWLSVHRGFTLEEYLRTPYLVLQQLYRGYLIQNPEVRTDSAGNPVVVEPSFINASDRLIGEWHTARRTEIAAVITANRHRQE